MIVSLSTENTGVVAAHSLTNIYIVRIYKHRESIYMYMYMVAIGTIQCVLGVVMVACHASRVSGYPLHDNCC